MTSKNTNYQDIIMMKIYLRLKPCPNKRPYTNRMGDGGKWKVFLPIKSAASCEAPLVCLFTLSCFVQIA